MIVYRLFCNNIVLTLPCLTFSTVRSDLLFHFRTALTDAVPKLLRVALNRPVDPDLLRIALTAGVLAENLGVALTDVRKVASKLNEDGLEEN